MRWFLSLLLVALSVGQMMAQSPPTVAEQYLFSAANAARAEQGLTPLRWDPLLANAALAHAREMAARRSISHQYPGEPELAVRGKQAGARFSLISENVAEAQTAVRIHDAWMHSPGHRANLLDAKVDSVGISVVRRDGQLYAVQDFDRSVVAMSLPEQERVLAGLVTAVTRLEVLPTVEAARQTCGMRSGFAGELQPGFVMRFTAGDLTRLPESLRPNLLSGRYRQVMVAACAPANDEGAFSSFHLAVLLF